MKKYLLLIGLFFAIILTSCSIQKRLYRYGYNLEWKQINQNTAEPITNVGIKNKIDTDTVLLCEPYNNRDNELLASLELIEIPNPSSEFLKLKEYNPSQIFVFSECDIILLRSGEEIQAKVLEVGINEIKYKKCSQLNGPTYIFKKDEIFMIKYSDGNKDIFEKKTTQENVKISTQQESTFSEKCKQGESDANTYHNGGGWFLGGIFFGLFAVIAAAIIEPKVKSPPTEVSYDPYYRDCYTKRARKSNLYATLTGWLIGIFILVMIYLVQRNGQF